MRQRDLELLEPSTSYGGSLSMVATPPPSPSPPPRLDNSSAHGGDEVAAMLMQVAEKAERCWNFDLQHWLAVYRRVRFGDVNFPEAAMLVACAAQIYGRKVDYLSDIIIHMNDDQKAREQKTQAEAKANEGQVGEKEMDGQTAKSTGRKRAGRFNPQSLSDCFTDLEFTCNDKKLAKLESLIKPAPIVDVDRRTKVQQMQDLCSELRANPTRQRRQEILNRLRDDACIAPIMSSNGAALKNQILDLESGETIGTRYDYQIHLNYIDGRTGSLIAEHDLKRFFQRCDVMDFLSEQHLSERERCSRLGKPAPADMLAQRERELKLYMPPEYLSNRYRIMLQDTSDFDNALIQARVTNYDNDPILSLMDHAARAGELQPGESWQKENTLSSLKPSAMLVERITTAKGEEKPQDDSGIGDDTIATDPDDSDPSFSGVLCSSRTNETTLELDSSVQQSANQSTLKPETNTSLDNSTAQEGGETITSTTQSEESATKSVLPGPRLSVDEGIGVDRESPPRSGETQVEEAETRSGTVLFTGGIVFPRSPVLRPVKLVRNILGIPEDLARKHVQFALPMEYRKLKSEFVKRRQEQQREKLTVQLHSLKPTADSLKRPSTPEPEDFLGFEDELDQQLAIVSNKRIKNEQPSTESSSPVRQKRPSTPEDHDFNGFDEEEILTTRKAFDEWLKRMPEKAKCCPKSPRRAIVGSSLPITPTRTLSCDSGISDTVERNMPSNAPPSPQLEPLAEDTGGDSDCDTKLHRPATPETVAQPDKRTVPCQPGQEHTDASNARIQQSMHEAKERFDKVSQWHRKLKPILTESEKRNHFDIHAYGTDIIDTFDPSVPLGTEAITLEQVLQHKPPHSTARFFLSVLMLANTNNVQICNKNQDPLRLSSTAEIELRLLSRKRHHKELEALGELLPPNDDQESDRKRQQRKNRKRKIVLQQGHQAVQSDDDAAVPRADPSVRLTGGLDEAATSVDDASFLDNVQRIYEDMNSADSQRKRMAFRRGMRNCAYGLEDNTAGPSQSKPGRPSIPPPSTKAPPDCERVTLPLPAVVEPTDELLLVDLITNNATMIPASDQDTTCAKSVFSFAESGYESILSGGEDM
uniref:Condensin-2 complex subunit H2 C-terminal domain-containing protein n=1 Tax=Anopheles epiroticus TaxID=199890 RepID=A0A182P266_9DIPT